MVAIQQVIDAWNLSIELHAASGHGVTDAEIAEAERLIGRALPEDFRQLYRAFNGGAFVGGNIMLQPLGRDSELLSVVTNSDRLREWEWPIPEELVVFGGNGSDDLYGIWLPTEEGSKPIILTVGSIFEPASFAVVGDDIAGFLAGRTAFYLMSYASDGIDVEPALDALGVPNELRIYESDDESDDLSWAVEDDSERIYFDLMNWANPNLPDKEVDVYRNAWTAEQVAAFAALPE